MSARVRAAARASIAERRLWLLPWLRALALLVGLLSLAAQQRTLVPALRPSVVVLRIVAERVQHIESTALRAEAAVRVAPATLGSTRRGAPVLARLPWFPIAQPAMRWPSELISVAPDTRCELGRGLSHFHSKRRIPRMNSEEPPRA